MTTNYEAAKAAVNMPERVGAAQALATLAIADELRAIKDLLESVAGVTGLTGGGKGRRFVRVFDEAP